LQPYLEGTAAITDKHWGLTPTCREPQGPTIGMMEKWNCGMMGFKKAEFKTANYASLLTQHSNLPLLHYSMWLTKSGSHIKYYNYNKLWKF
jgi:hypothetical protein